MIKTAMIFTDKMVLQRDKEIPVWGWADPGSQITVSLCRNNNGETTEPCTVNCTASPDGEWFVNLPSHDAGAGFEMTITDGTDTIAYTDVCIGEVWIAGGQSNMEYLLAFEKHFDEVQYKEKDPLIRFFDYPEVSYEGELNDFDYKNYGFWRGCTPDDLQYFSAVGYYFSRQLKDSLDVPIGIVGCNWGGTTACSWIERERLVGTVGEFWITDYEEAIKGLDVEVYKREFVSNPQNDRTDELHNPFSVHLVKKGSTREEQLAMMAQWEESGENGMPVIGPYYERRPGGLYETMLKKIVPYGMRGVIWYQGESDTDKNPEAYETVFSILIQNWRELWNEQFPFLFVQLAPFNAWLACGGDNYPALRKTQETVSKTVPNTWMASIGDAGMEWDIHPKDKKKVGSRLGLLARAHVYGESDILADAPEAVSAVKDGENVVITFDNADGLFIEGDRINALKGVICSGDDTAAGSEEIVELTSARVDGSTLIISACGKISEIRFAQDPYYEVNLYNEANIPAKPFTFII